MMRFFKILRELQFCKTFNEAHAHMKSGSISTNMTTVAKWGIVGTGKICHDFTLAIGILDRKLHEVNAVMGRSLPKVEEFAKTHNIETFSTNLECLTKNDEINIVYIGVVNTEHFRFAKSLLKAGKNVLCEKPMCMNLSQTEELINIARENKVFLMEALWSRCFPIYQTLKQRMGDIGEIFQVNANLGFPLTKVERLTSQDLGGGSVLDLGVYVLQFAQFVFPDLDPIEIQAAGHLSNDGVDLNAGIVIKFPKGKTAVLSCNATAMMSNNAEVFGEKGVITITDFWCPTTISGGPNKELQIEVPLPESAGTFNFYHSNGLSYEAEEVRRCISEGLLESPLMTLEQSHKLAEWRDIIHTKIGRKF